MIRKTLPILLLALAAFAAADEIFTGEDLINNLVSDVDGALVHEPADLDTSEVVFAQTVQGNAAGCVDTLPPKKTTCDSLKAKGKCDKTWLIEAGYCAATCGRCKRVSAEPTEEPTLVPVTSVPTEEPTPSPTEFPTVEPTALPTAEPSVAPTGEPSTEPTGLPTVAPTAAPTLSIGEAKPVNVKLFGIGDDWTKLKGGGRIDFKQLKDAVSALGLGQTRFPGGANSNYWDIGLANTPTIPSSPTAKCPAPGWAGFSKADEGQVLKIADKKVTIAGVERKDVPWGFGNKVKDASGEILSVDEAVGGKVTIADGSEFENPGAAPSCTCETMVCPKKGFSLCMLEMQTAEAPKDHLTLTNFLKHIVSDTDQTMPIIVLNVLTMPMERTKQIVKWLGENLASFRADAGTARAESEPILIEIGNEFYLDAMYDCFLGTNASTYADILHELVPFIRDNLPVDTRIGIVGFQGPFLGGEKSGIHYWNEQLKESGILEKIDAITLHDYRLNTDVAKKKGNEEIFGRELSEDEQASAQAAWGAASTEATQQHFVDGVFAGKTAWVTEYGVLQKHYAKSTFLDSTRLSGVPGLFTLGRILAAVRFSDVFESLEWFNLGFAYFGLSMMINMEEVLNDSENGEVKVNGNAQMFAHVSSLAMKATTMHGISVVEGPSLPFVFHHFGEQEAAKCIQAGAFVNTDVVSVIIINRCQTEVPVTFDVASSTGHCGADQQCEASAWLYPTKPGDGEWEPLPANADAFPWPGPLHPHKVAVPLAGGIASVETPPLSLSIATFEA